MEGVHPKNLTGTYAALMATTSRSLVYDEEIKRRSVEAFRGFGFARNCHLLLSRPFREVQQETSR